MKDSLWSVDMFRCESATLRTHWVLLVIDQYPRRIIDLAVHARTVAGMALCRMFNRAIRGSPAPKYLSSDHDPLYTFHRWHANLRILDVTEIKTIPMSRYRIPSPNDSSVRFAASASIKCVSRTNAISSASSLISKTPTTSTELTTHSTA
jgi:hypothetical protein